MNKIAPTQVQEDDPKTLGMLRDNMAAQEREIDFNIHSADEISKMIRMSDGQPGAAMTINHDGVEETLYAFDAHIDDVSSGTSASGKCFESGSGAIVNIEYANPGDIVAKRHKAVAVVCKDGGLVWVGHMKKGKKGNCCKFQIFMI